MTANPSPQVMKLELKAFRIREGTLRRSLEFESKEADRQAQKIGQANGKLSEKELAKFTSAMDRRTQKIAKLSEELKDVESKIANHESQLGIKESVSNAQDERDTQLAGSMSTSAVAAEEGAHELLTSPSIPPDAEHAAAPPVEASELSEEFGRLVYDYDLFGLHMKFWEKGFVSFFEGGAESAPEKIVRCTFTPVPAQEKVMAHGISFESSETPVWIQKRPGNAMYFPYKILSRIEEIFSISTDSREIAWEIPTIAPESRGTYKTIKKNITRYAADLK